VVKRFKVLAAACTQCGEDRSDERVIFPIEVVRQHFPHLVRQTEAIERAFPRDGSEIRAGVP
jgi:hypothetical protein